MGAIVRPCTPQDLKDIMRLVKEIASIYTVPLNSLRTNVEELKKAGFGENPRYECFVAEVPPEQKSKEGHTIIGYTLFTRTYNTWRRKNIYMDNLYVMPEFRGRCIGSELMDRVAEAAWSQGYTQLRMHASAKKPEVIQFQVQRKGEDLTIKEGWHLFRFPNEVLHKLAAQSKF